MYINTLKLQGKDSNQKNPVIIISSIHDFNLYLDTHSYQIYSCDSASEL